MAILLYQISFFFSDIVELHAINGNGEFFIAHVIYFLDSDCISSMC